jgi:phenylalanyl-tRNA synthetase beta chain
MWISLKWLLDFVHLPEAPEQLAEALTQVGLEIEGQETYSSLPPLEGLVVGEVVTTEPHPEADRLTLARVELGDDTPRQIVCGAPNVAAGQKVAVALPGTTLHPTGGEPFKIKKGKIRGQVSEGMICAEDEIGLGTDHEGILVLDPHAPVGAPLAEHLPAYHDELFEIGLTPNRIDAANHLGVARDLSAWFRRKLCRPQKAILPAAPEVPEAGPDLRVEAPEACPRYAGLYFPEVRIVESPAWMRNRLQAIGIKPRNVWVDATNYVMHEMGHPLHAFDAAHIEGGLCIRKAQPDERLTTLDGQERTLAPGDLLIADGEKPLALAGILGGQDSGIQEQTRAVFLESAYFEPVGIRKSARRHQLSTDAAFRFERGADPQAVPAALGRMLFLLREAGALPQDGSVHYIDRYPKPQPPRRIDFSPSYLDDLAGQDITRQEILEILSFLEIEVDTSGGQPWRLTIPTNKPDVTRPADVAEEILRIYGYNHIQFSETLRFEPGRSTIAPLERFRRRLRAYLCDLGGLEAAHNSIVDARPAEQPEAYIRLANPLTAELNAMRPRLLEGGLESIAHNLNRQQYDLLLFELGKVYFREANDWREEEHLGVWLTGSYHRASWHTPERQTDVFHLKAIAENLLTLAGAAPETLAQEAFG